MRLAQLESERRLQGSAPANPEEGTPSRSWLGMWLHRGAVGPLGSQAREDLAVKLGMRFPGFRRDQFPVAHGWFLAINATCSLDFQAYVGMAGDRVSGG